MKSIRIYTSSIQSKLIFRIFLKFIFRSFFLNLISWFSDFLLTLDTIGVHYFNMLMNFYTVLVCKWSPFLKVSKLITFFSAEKSWCNVEYLRILNCTVSVQEKTSFFAWKWSESKFRFRFRVSGNYH